MQKIVMRAMAGTYCMINTFNLSLIQLYCTGHFSSVYKTLSHTQTYLSLKKMMIILNQSY